LRPEGAMPMALADEFQAMLVEHMLAMTAICV